MDRRITKRQFLKMLALGGGLGGIAWLSGLFKLLEVYAGSAGQKINLPLVSNNSRTPTPTLTATVKQAPTSTQTSTATSTASKTASSTTPTKTASSTPTKTASSTPTKTATATQSTPSGGGHKIIHVHAISATSWNYSTGWYGNYVNQNVVNNMVDEGVKRVTGQSVVSSAWQTILPGYATGKGIAIKLNFNNAQDCNDSDNLIDALVQPVNAIIQGLKQMGVQESDVWLYDAVRPIPARFKSGCLYSGVRLFDRDGCSGNELATFDSTDPNSQISFRNTNLKTRKITDVVVNASYLINMPILKDHGIAPVTLCCKNHFGTINYIMGSGSDDLHQYIDPGNSTNPLVDINSNLHIRTKTKLIVGDGLYGAYGGSVNNTPPTRWSSFGNAAANSLFFSTDPIAVECVMFDILNAEPSYHPLRGADEDDYLIAASQAGLGQYERGDPWGSGYKVLNYQKVEL